MRPPIPLPVRSAKTVLGLLVLASLLLGGAVLRVRNLDGPSLWLDEILNYDIALESGELPLGAWLTGFERENGPLYFATLVAGQAASPRVETAARLGAVAAGVVSLLLMAWLGGRLAGWSGALTAAALLAVSPLHVVYSREGRTYSLLMLLALVLVAGLLERQRLPGRGCLVAGSVLAAYTAATAAPLLAGVGAVALGLGISDRRQISGKSPPSPSSQRSRGAVWGAASAVAGLGLVAVLYGSFEPADPARPFSAEGLAHRWILGFTVSGLDIPGAAAGRVPPAALGVLALALLGLVALARRPRTLDAALALGGMAVLPPLFALAALAWRDHWLSIRYLSPGLPAFLLLAALGLTAMGRGLGNGLEAVLRQFGRKHHPTSLWSRVIGAASTAVTAALLVAALLPAARSEPYRKPDWRQAAEILAALSAEDETVLAADDWTFICLGFYLEHVKGARSLEVLNLQGSVPVGRRLAREREAVWLASGGGLVPRRMRAWMRRFPQVAGEGLGGPRLFFRPDLATLAARPVTPDPELWLSGFWEDRTLRFDRSDPLFVGTGWSKPERGAEGVTFRWAVGREAELLVPGLATTAENAVESAESRPGAAAMRLRARPFSLPGGEPQEIEVLVNGRALGRFVMAPGWRSYDVSVPGSVRQSFLDRVTLRFSRATAPATVHPGSRDRRRLAAAVDELTVGP